MVGAIGKTAAALGLAGVALLAVGATSFARTQHASFAMTGAETSVPFGWVEFCQRYQEECREETRVAPRDIVLNRAAMRIIRRVNRTVNRSIQPLADKEHFDAIDQWDYPADGKGDCEDYALQKRRLLIEEGFPAEALLMTVVKEANGDGHSVLTVKTDRGEYVLDNLTDRVKSWDATPYRFVKRQSQENPNSWVSIGAPVDAAMYVSR